VVGPNKHTHTRAHEVTLVWGLTQARPNHCYFGTYPFSSFIISDSFRGIIVLHVYSTAVVPAG